MGMENIQNNPSQKQEKPNDGVESDNMNAIVGAVSGVLDSLEGGNSQMAVAALRDSGMSFSELTVVLDKIPDAGRDNIGRISDFFDGTRNKGSAEAPLTARLIDRLEDRVAMGADIEDVRQLKQLFDDRGIPEMVQRGIAARAIEKTKKKGFGSEAYIQEVFTYESKGSEEVTA